MLHQLLLSRFLEFVGRTGAIIGEVAGFDLGAVAHINVVTVEAPAGHIAQFDLGASAFAMRACRQPLAPLLDGLGIGLGRHRFRYRSCLLPCVLGAGAQLNPASAVVAVLHGHIVVEAHAFPRLPCSALRCKVSLQQLLNCLDGIDSQDGVIVVATANDPTVLDAAILRRPGRFDRVVALPAPGRELRHRYFRKFNSHLDEEALSRAAEDSDGFSFAQLKEAYILAGQRAFERNTALTGNGLLEGIRVLRGSMAFVSDHKWKVGFVESSFQEAEINAVAMGGR